MRMRHAVVTASEPGRATVTLDGTSVVVPVSAMAALPVGDIAVLLQEGRTIVALTTDGDPDVFDFRIIAGNPFEYVILQGFNLRITTDAYGFRRIIQPGGTVWWTPSQLNGGDFGGTKAYKADIGSVTLEFILSDGSIAGWHSFLVKQTFGTPSPPSNVSSFTLPEGSHVNTVKVTLAWRDGTSGVTYSYPFYVPSGGYHQSATWSQVVGDEMASSETLIEDLAGARCVVSIAPLLDAYGIPRLYEITAGSTWLEENDDGRFNSVTLEGAAIHWVRPDGETGSTPISPDIKPSGYLEFGPYTNTGSTTPDDSCISSINIGHFVVT